jgi:hypothetical protein
VATLQQKFCSCIGTALLDLRLAIVALALRSRVGLRGAAMTIHRLLQNSPLEPDDIHRLVTAYEQTLRTLGISDRSDPITLMVAKTVIEIGQTGIRDPAQISQLAIKAIGDV